MELDLEATSPTVSVVDITPDIAQSLLDLNTRNRVVSVDQVITFAKAMVNDQWALNGETIKISTVPELEDGQHRLLAVVRANKTVRMMVVTGVVPETKLTVDRGRKRTVADDLRIDGQVEYKSLGALARRLYSLAEGDLTGGGNKAGRYATDLDLHAIIDDNHDRMVEAVLAGAKLRRYIKVPPSIGSLAFWQLAEIDHAAAEEFFEKLGEGHGLEKGDPIALLRKTIIERTTLRQSRLREDVMLAFIYKTWNAWRDGRTFQLLRFAQRGQVVEQFPVPH